VLFLSGCMVTPDLGPKAELRKDLITYKQGSNNVSYPNHNWWKDYQDTQLTTLIEEGLENSPSITEAMARVQNANAIAIKAGASYLPSASIDGSLTKFRQSYNMGVPKNFVPKGFRDLGMLNANFSYELDFWGKNTDTLNAAVSNVEAAKLMFEQAKIILSTAIAEAYANLAQYSEELEVAQETMSVRAQTLDLFEKRHKNGLENESTVQQARSNLAMAEAEHASLDERVHLTKNALVVLVGATPDRAVTITSPNLSSLVPQGVPTVIPADLISRRPDLIAAEYMVKAAASQINIAEAGYYPNINLTGYIGHQSLGLGTFLSSDSTIGSFGPAIHLPIFDKKRVESAYMASYADYHATLSTYESAILQALREVADAITSHKALATRTSKTKAALIAAEKAHKIAKSRYHGGLSTYLEVLRAEDGLITARRAMAQIKARAFILDVALIKALGGGFKIAAIPVEGSKTKAEVL
jgi:NodT family efflux transporter outer membrane factor (OMF) lipoprotein